MNQAHLKSALLALTEKLKYLENVEQEKKLIVNQLEQSDIARKELRINIKDNGERIKEEKEKSTKF